MGMRLLLKAKSSYAEAPPSPVTCPLANGYPTNEDNFTP